MQVIDIQTSARKLMDAHGTKAVAEAAQKAVELERLGSTEEAQDWRRIESALKQMLGPKMS